MTSSKPYPTWCDVEFLPGWAVLRISGPGGSRTEKVPLREVSA